MNQTPPDIQARRSVEDRAVQLGSARNELAARTTQNTQAIIDLLREPTHTLISLDHLANLLGVSRQSLYRWREIGQEIPAGTSATEWLSMQDEDGAFIHYKG
jgi:DNA-binding transcriptional regulator YiaG